MAKTTIQQISTTTAGIPFPILEESEVTVLKSSSGIAYVGIGGPTSGLALPLDQPVQFTVAANSQLWVWSAIAGEMVGLVITAKAPTPTVRR